MELMKIKIEQDGFMGKKKGDVVKVGSHHKKALLHYGYASVLGEDKDDHKKKKDTKTPRNK